MTMDLENARVDFEGLSEEIPVEDPILWAKDPRNPLRWSMPKRLFHTAFPSLLAFEM